jgi:DNA-binding NarL/FixJ family response regulator
MWLVTNGDGGVTIGADPIRVVIADDHVLYRRGLQMVVSQDHDIEIVGEAGDGKEAVDRTVELLPDVVLMDVRMPRLDGLAATTQVLDRAPGTRVIVLTTFDVDDYVFAALRIGASGFLLKSSPPERLIRAIRLVASGDAMLDPVVTRRVIERFATQPEPVAHGPELDRLTERELEVLREVSRGLSNAEIAAELFIGETTVKTHVARILAKLGLRDRVQAVVYAYEHGVVALAPRTDRQNGRDGSF